MQFKRYAIYYIPAPGPLALFGARWLGWDPVAGEAVAHPEIPGLPAPISQLTATPRAYGLHATLKPPFRLADGMRADDLNQRLGTYCATSAPVTLDRLEVTALGRFLALTPVGAVGPLMDLAAGIVTEFDMFRAPMTEAELIKRRARRLSADQDALLLQWGYPFVMEQFRFHITLTGKLPRADVASTAAVLAARIDPLLDQPFVIDGLGLLGEDDHGQFHLIERHPLAGAG